MVHRGKSGTFAAMLSLASLCLGLGLCLCLCLGRCDAYFSLEIGDPCPTVGYRSRCQSAEAECGTLASHIQVGHLTPQTIAGCGFTSRGEKICCPLENASNMDVRIDSNESTTTTTTTTKTTTTTTTTQIPTTTSTTTEAPGADDWLNIFQTDHEFLQRSIEPTRRPARDSFVYPDTREGAECRAPLYEGECRAVSACPSVEPLLAQGRLRDEDFMTCRDGAREEIICCPLNLPLQPRGQVKTATRLGVPPLPTRAPVPKEIDIQEVAAIARADALLPHYRHLGALAHHNAAFDGHLHHCAAIVLTPQFLLSAAGCERPSHAVFGVADMRDVDVDEDYLVDIVRLEQFRRDLALMRLQEPLRLGSGASANVSVAPICNQFELTRLQVSGRLVAVGWGKGEDTDCPLYEMPMRLRPTRACGDLPNYGSVQELPSSHLCVEPQQPETDLQPFSNASSCAACPGTVGSVLHLVRPNASRCVLGIATPTGVDCDVRVMYFTNLLSPQFTLFVEQQQQQQQQPQQG